MPDFMHPSMKDVFTGDERSDIEAHKPEDVEKVEIVHKLSPAFGAIERGVNEAKKMVEEIEGLDHEVAYEFLDQICDHAYEVWRHLVYGEEMIRWKRNP